ncbi:MAG: hypothetical protein ACRYF0_02745 [Janthinobacterium lividum]
MALALLPSFSALFSVAYELRTDILLGAWAGGVPAAALPGCYDQLLAAARAHGNCRFWLLRLQQRNWHDEGFGQWFNEEFAPWAGAALGSPLFVACVMHPSQRPHVEASRTEQLLRRVAGRNIFPFYFENETDARDWLCDQQAGEQPAAGPRPRVHELVS